MEDTIALIKATSNIVWPICFVLIVFLFRKKIRKLLSSLIPEEKDKGKTIGDKLSETQTSAPIKIDDIVRRPMTNEEGLHDTAKCGNFVEKTNEGPMCMFELPASSGYRNEIMKEKGSISTPRKAQYRRQPFASQKMASCISHNQLHLEFQDGGSCSWTLPNPKDKARIREVLYKAMAFAKDHHASRGQINAVRKKLTDEGYHLTK